MNEKKIGVFLSRMQPIHNAHIWMIENALKENDEVLIIIGSANRKNEDRNPFDIITRRKLIENAIEEKKKKNYKERIKIIELPDWSSEKNNDDTEWGRLIYYNVVAKMNVKHFSYYCSESPELIKGWFEDKIKERINFRFFSRNNQFNGLSATRIRKAILEDNKEYVKQYCPNSVIEKFDELRETLLLNIK
jgi:cytidyltransferase-like protein